MFLAKTFKTVQKITNTGFPSSWEGRRLQSTPVGAPLTLDQMASKAKALNLPGKVTLHFPKGPKGVFSVSNQNPSDIYSQKKIHFDQYSGRQILSNNWEDVGVLMRGRMWVMAFHQGEFGVWNWWLMLAIAIALTIMSVSALVSYILRKRKGTWGDSKSSGSIQNRVWNNSHYRYSCYYISFIWYKHSDNSAY